GIKNDVFSILRESYNFNKTVSVSGDTLLLNYRLSYLLPEVATEKANEFAADIRKIANDHLSYAISFPNLTGSNNAKKYSWAAILYALGFGIICFIAGRYIYRLKKQPAVYPEEDLIYTQIGGWLILPLIGFIIT